MGPEPKVKCNFVKLFGLRLWVRKFDRQVGDVQIRAAILNRFTAHGMLGIEAIGKMRLGKGKLNSRPICASKSLQVARSGTASSRHEALTF